MSRNKSEDTLENRLVKKINDLQKQIDDMRTNQITFNGYFTLPSGTSDPADAPDGAVYYKSDTDVYRKKANGSWSNW